jgi:hypothetical protein
MPRKRGESKSGGECKEVSEGRERKDWRGGKRGTVMRVSCAAT